MFYRKTFSVFRNALRVSLKAESEHEDLRKELVNNPHFRIHEAFFACDLDNNGILNVEIFKGLLERAGSTRGGNRVTEAEAKNLLFKFDWNRDQRVHFEEFAVELQPKSPF